MGCPLGFAPEAVCPCEGQVWRRCSCLGRRGSGSTRYSGGLAARAAGRKYSALEGYGTQYWPICSSILAGEPPSLTETPGRVVKSRTLPEWPSTHRCKTFLPVEALPQWEFSVKVVQLLGLRGPWWRQEGSGTDCLRHRIYGPVRVFSRASYSWRSEGLFGQSFSVAPPDQALTGLPCLGPFSVVQHIRHLKRHPGWGPTL